MKRRLTVKTRDQVIHLLEGEFVIFSRGVEQMPVGDEEAFVMLFEKKTTINAGRVQSEETALDRWV